LNSKPVDADAPAPPAVDPACLPAWERDPSPEDPDAMYLVMPGPAAWDACWAESERIEDEYIAGLPTSPPMSEGDRMELMRRIALALIESGRAEHAVRRAAAAPVENSLDSGA
jgi:hypothetical protein